MRSKCVASPTNPSRASRSRGAVNGVGRLRADRQSREQTRTNSRLPACSHWRQRRMLPRETLQGAAHRGCRWLDTVPVRAGSIAGKAAIGRAPARRRFRSGNDPTASALGPVVPDESCGNQAGASGTADNRTSKIDLSSQAGASSASAGAGRGPGARPPEALKRRDRRVQPRAVEGAAGAIKVPAGIEAIPPHRVRACAARGRYSLMTWSGLGCSSFGAWL